MNIKKYQINKTVRFKLDNSNIKIKDSALKPPETNTDNKEKYIDELITNLETIFKDIKLLFFYEKEICFNRCIQTYKKITFTNKLKVKYQWLRDYTKNEFHTFKEKQEKIPKQYQLNTIDYLPDLFKESINNCVDIVHELSELKKQPQQDQRRKREFAFLLRQLKKRSHLEFLEEFVKAIHNNNQIEITNWNETFNVDETLKELKDSFIKTQAVLKEAIGVFLPAQTEGIELIRATFNYYTLNKTPKEYDDEIKKCKEKIHNKLDNELFTRSHFDKQKREKVIDFECNDGFFKGIQLAKNLNWTLETAYKEIKKWKADQKNKFLECVNKINDCNEITDEKLKAIKDDHPLFQSDNGKLEDFIKKTIEIQKLANIKNKVKNNEKIETDEQEMLKRNSLEKDTSKIQSKITELKKQRGEFFNFKEGKSKPEIITKNYYELCEFFKRIALKRGQALAKIKSLEYEKVDAELLTHWAFVLEKDNKHHLVIVPRADNELNTLKNELDNLKDCNQKQGTVLYSFASLTLRALEKLCFKEHSNTFAPKIKEEFIEQGKIKKDKHGNPIKDKKGKEIADYPTYKRELYQKDDELIGDKKLIAFYQAVLNTDYAKKEISKYSGIDKIIKKDYSQLKKPLDEFRKNLEQCCYVKRQYIEQNFIDNLVSTYKAAILPINSLDLQTERDNEQVEKDKQDKNKDTSLMRTIHNETTQNEPTTLWKQFWNDEENKNSSYPTRLNPELKIFWREPRESRVKKYGEKSANFDSTKKNRFLEPQYTVAMTFMINAGEKDLAFSWDSSLEIKDKIQQFNEHYKENNNGDYLYGIDRGLKELATLCIVKDDGASRLKEFPTITTYTLKEDKYYYQSEIKDPKDKTDIPLGKYDKGFGGPITNISLIADKFKEKQWFEKIESKENACFDLSTAKVIKGKIVTNGDLHTFLNLKEISAKRKIFELFHHGEIKNNYGIGKSKNTFFIQDENKQAVKSNNKGEDDKFTLYWLTEKQKSSFEKLGQPILNELNKYLDELREKQQRIEKEKQDSNITDKKQNKNLEPPIEKINHLRDAITANMVGVIYHLHQQFPAKAIKLENLDEFKEQDGMKFIESHRKQSDQHISRRLEWSLYKKFQQQGLVPPNIKETILLKDEFKQTQFGIVKFIQTGGTSSNCPNCDENVGKNPCKKCGFHVENNRQSLIPLDNYDKVAAYNIAKM